MNYCERPPPLGRSENPQESIGFQQFIVFSTLYHIPMQSQSIFVIFRSQMLLFVAFGKYFNKLDITFTNFPACLRKKRMSFPDEIHISVGKLILKMLFFVIFNFKPAPAEHCSAGTAPVLLRPGRCLSPPDPRPQRARSYRKTIC